LLGGNAIFCSRYGIARQQGEREKVRRRRVERPWSENRRRRRWRKKKKKDDDDDDDDNNNNLIKMINSTEQDLFSKLQVSMHLIKKFPALYGTQMFNTTLTTDCLWTLP
jgi:hypothetical protein